MGTDKNLLFYILLFVLLSVSFNIFANSAAQSENFKVSVASTAAGSIPHEIDLKVTQVPGGQLSEVSGFVIGPEDVIQVKQGENLIISTSQNLKAQQVTVRNIQGQQVNLLPLPTNIWSLQDLIPGVYTLDVIVDMSSSGILGTYETILVVLEPGQQPLPPTTVINRITVERSECPTNSTLVNGTCIKPTPSPVPPPNATIPIIPPPNATNPILPPGPNPPDGDGCPEGQVRNEEGNCAPPGDEVCPEGQVGTPPNCETPSEDGASLPSFGGEGGDRDNRGGGEGGDRDNRGGGEGGGGGQERPLPSFPGG